MTPVASVPPAAKPVSPVATAAKAVPAARADLNADGQPKPFVFADTSRFDSQLSDTLGNAPASLEILSETAMSPNEIPPRLEKWFSAIVKSGGKVKLQRVSAKKPLAAEGAATRDFIFWEVFDLAFTIYDYVHEIILYAPAKKYDALVSFNGTEIQDITFIKRESEP